MEHLNPIPDTLLQYIIHALVEERCDIEEIMDYYLPLSSMAVILSAADDLFVAVDAFAAGSGGWSKKGTVFWAEVLIELEFPIDFRMMR